MNLHSNSVENYSETKMGEKLSSSYTNTITDLLVFLKYIDSHWYSLLSASLSKNSQN